LSLIPFTTSWVGQNYTAAEPMALYGLVLLMCAVAYFILHRTLWNFHEEGTLLRQVSERGRKEWISMLLYALAIWLAYLSSWLSIAVYVLIAILWIRPNRSLEKRQLRDDKR
ncbi:MAG: TMEM175 family protein, partial [Owenweeksia sp.]